MNDQYWSWLLTIVGLTGFVLATRKVWWCWYINIACQALWFTYAIVTEQYGFIVASLAYTVVFTQGAIKWTRDHRAERARIDGLIRQPIGRIDGLTQDERGLYAKGYVDADVAASLKLYDLKSNDPRSREDEMIKAAMSLLEKRIRDKTASVEEVVYLLRLARIDPLRE